MSLAALSVALLMCAAPAIHVVPGPLSSHLSTALSRELGPGRLTETSSAAEAWVALTPSQDALQLRVAREGRSIVRRQIPVVDGDLDAAVRVAVMLTVQAVGHHTGSARRAPSDTTPRPTPKAATSSSARALGASASAPPPSGAQIPRPGLGPPGGHRRAPQPELPSPEDELETLPGAPRTMDQASTVGTESRPADPARRPPEQLEPSEVTAPGGLPRGQKELPAEPTVRSHQAPGAARIDAGPGA